MVCYVEIIWHCILRYGRIRGHFYRNVGIRFFCPIVCNSPPIKKDRELSFPTKNLISRDSMHLHFDKMGMKVNRDKKGRMRNGKLKHWKIKEKISPCAFPFERM